MQFQRNKKQVIVFNCGLQLDFPQLASFNELNTRLLVQKPYDELK